MEKYQVWLLNKRPHLISGEGRREIVRWFPSEGGLTVEGLVFSELLTPDNCDLSAVKQMLAGLVTSP